MKKIPWYYCVVFVLSPLWLALILFIGVLFEVGLALALWMFVWAAIAGILLGFIPSMLTALVAMRMAQWIKVHCHRYQIIRWIIYTALFGSVSSTLFGILVTFLTTNGLRYHDIVYLLLFGFMGMTCALFACLYLLYKHKKNLLAHIGH